MVTEFRLLGPVEVYADGSRTDVGSARSQALLAALLCDANQAVSVDHLVERVWGNRRLPKHPRNAVQTYISLLKRSLVSAGGPTIVRRTHGYMIELDVELLDLHRFRCLIGKARSDRGGAVGLYKQAIGLWRGRALGALDTPWADGTREALEVERRAAEADLTDIQLSLGQHAALLPMLTDLSAAYPLDERLAGQFMLALFRSGRRAEALRHYHGIRQQLGEELGTDPGPSLQLLFRQLLAEDPAVVGPPAGEGPMPPPPSHDPAFLIVPRQLPAGVRPFVGRRDQLDRLDTFLGEAGGHRAGGGVAVALSGAPGIGKTALAVHWAHSVADRFPDGQLYANLRGFDAESPPLAPSDILWDFLDALGVPSARVPPALEARAGLYRSVMSGKRILVVLDNARDGGQARPLLPGTPTAFALVTSRDQLTSLVVGNGAQPLTVDPLTPGEGSELLAQRLGDLRTSVQPGTIAEIVRACAGLPLGLTIVAARARQTGFPLAVLAAELGTADRYLDQLDAGDPAGQLRTAFSWSYSTLSPPAARLFRLLATHVAPEVTTAAAAGLTASPLRQARLLLGELAQASLLVEHMPDRYTCHDLLHAYAKELHDSQDAGGTAPASPCRESPFAHCDQGQTAAQPGHSGL